MGKKRQKSGKRIVITFRFVSKTIHFATLSGFLYDIMQVQTYSFTSALLRLFLL